MRKLNRVLIVDPGPLGRRLVSYYRGRGTETVVAFGEAEADREILDEADYAGYLNGREMAKTYGDPDRVLSLAIDSGCDAVHPGLGMMLGNVQLVGSGANVAIGVVGCDPQTLGRIFPPALRERAKKGGLKAWPTSGAILPGDDGEAAAASVGFPCVLVDEDGTPLTTIDAPDQLASALEQCSTGTRFLQASDASFERVQIPVLFDRHGHAHTFGALRADPGGLLWRTMTGSGLLQPTVALAKSVDFVGLGTAQWLVKDGGGFFHHLRPGLPDAWPLVEALWRVDLIDLQHNALFGEVIDPVFDPPPHVGFCAAIHHKLGEVEDWKVQTPAAFFTGLEPGFCFEEGQPDLLGWLVASGPEPASAMDGLLGGLAGFSGDGVLRDELMKRIKEALGY